MARIKYRSRNCVSRVEPQWKVKCYRSRTYLAGGRCNKIFSARIRIWLKHDFCIPRLWKSYSFCVDDGQEYKEVSIYWHPEISEPWSCKKSRKFINRPITYSLIFEVRNWRVKKCLNFRINILAFDDLNGIEEM